MRLWFYQIFVNRHPGISQRYHRKHDGSYGFGRFISYVYLLWLNLAYYVFFCRWLGESEAAVTYEEKRLPLKASESVEASQQLKRKKRNLCIYLSGRAAGRKRGMSLSVDEYLAKLSCFDVISFDLFDTLVFRPFSEPADLFYVLGEQLDYLDFKRIRMEAEQAARNNKFRTTGSCEVTLDEIWDRLSALTGISKEKGMRMEMKTELALCYANPFMQRVFYGLQKMGKQIVITTDMYLPEDFLKDLLGKNGYWGYQALYVSCEIQKSKAGGSMFAHVRNSIITTETMAASAESRRKGSRIRNHVEGWQTGSTAMAHVGDSINSDVKMTGKYGFGAFWYPNVNRNSLLYRPYDMSPVIGGAYRGLVNNRIYCGDKIYGKNYEYGYIYGGLFAVGYCSFIHEYCRMHGIEKVLFLARDGEILKRVYDEFYPGEDTVYAYWSRHAAAKLSAGYLKYDFLRKMVSHKVNQKLSIREALGQMELSELALDFQAGCNAGTLNAEEPLTHLNAEKLVDFLNERWEQVLEIYRPQREAAGKWYRECIADAKKAAVVDIGWAGSGAAALRTLFEKEWHIPCRLTGIVAGTNTYHSAEPDMSETMLLNGTMVSYLYSASHNRELWKKHDPANMYNIYWELLTSSASPPFKGFYRESAGGVKLEFLKPEKNPEGIREIQEGIMEFARDYKKHFEQYPYMFRISGRDAYAPMMLAASYGERYLKEINRAFGVTVGVNT